MSTPNPRGYAVYCYMPVASLKVQESTIAELNKKVSDLERRVQSSNKAQELNGDGVDGSGVPPDVPLPPMSALNQTASRDIVPRGAEAHDMKKEEIPSTKLKPRLGEEDGDMPSTLPPMTPYLATPLMNTPSTSRDQRLALPLLHQTARRLEGGEKHTESGSDEEEEEQFPEYVGMYYK